MFLHWLSGCQFCSWYRCVCLLCILHFCQCLLSFILVCTSCTFVFPFSVLDFLQPVASFFSGIQLSRLKLLFSYIHPSVLTSESFLQKHNSISVLLVCPHKCSRQPADTFQDKARTSAFYFLADCKKKTFDFCFPAIAVTSNIVDFLLHCA